jgi:FkbM family methyltransferase
MKIATRDLNRIYSAPLQKRHYIAAKNMFTLYARPFDAYMRYLCGTGDYPTEVTVKTPSGSIPLTVYSSHDLLTVNEIFCREDYKLDGRDQVIVDFGSNIGISAAYFLSRNTTNFAYLFEPVSRNVQRLTANLKGFEGRYELSSVAIALEAGAVAFGCEKTGRYGGIGKLTGDSIQVEAVAANDVLEAIIAKHGHIDILKIDIETLESQVVESLTVKLAERILTCYVEYPFVHNPLNRTHQMGRYGRVAQFRSLTHHA